MASLDGGLDSPYYKQLVTLPKYAAWGPKEWFPLNIEGMYRLVQANRRGN